MSKEIKIIFPTEKRNSVGNADISNRLSRSMDSVESIVKHLEEYAETFSLRRFSSSLNLDKQRAKIERRSASLSHIDVSKVLGAEYSKKTPSDVLLPTDQYLR